MKKILTSYDYNYLICISVSCIHILYSCMYLVYTYLFVLPLHVCSKAWLGQAWSDQVYQMASLHYPAEAKGPPAYQAQGASSHLPVQQEAGSWQPQRYTIPHTTLNLKGYNYLKMIKFLKKITSIYHKICKYSEFIFISLKIFSWKLPRLLRNYFKDFELSVLNSVVQPITVRVLFQSCILWFESCSFCNLIKIIDIYIIIHVLTKHHSV